MTNLVLGLSFLLGGGLPSGQLGTGDLMGFNRMPARIEVLHADPWVIMSLLQGFSPPYPEMSTLGIFGFTPTLGQGGEWLIPRGILVVNPADNSIIYLPARGG